MVELKRSTLAVYRCLWEAHAEPRLGPIPLRDIDARQVVRFRGELTAAGVGPTSIVKTMSMLQRVFRDAVEYGDVAFNPFRAVQKPSPGPTREARPLMPFQVEQLAAHLAGRGHEASAALVRLMAYTGVRPQEALALHWYAVGDQTLLVELANTDGELDRLKNRKRSRKRSRSIDLVLPVREDLAAWRAASGDPGDDELIFPHESHGGLWLSEHYKTWRRRIYVPSAQGIGLPSARPYDLRHTWASLLIAEKRLSIADIAEQLGDKASTVLISTRTPCGTGATGRGCPSRARSAARGGSLPRPQRPRRRCQRTKPASWSSRSTTRLLEPSPRPQTRTHQTAPTAADLLHQSHR